MLWLPLQAPAHSAVLLLQHVLLLVCCVQVMMMTMIQRLIQMQAVMRGTRGMMVNDVLCVYFACFHQINTVLGHWYMCVCVHQHTNTLKNNTPHTQKKYKKTTKTIAFLLLGIHNPLLP